MSLDHGGHLTHGHKMNFSGQLYNVVPYGVNKDTETIDYDEVQKLATEHKPALIVAGASAYPRVIDFARLRQIADSVGAKLMVDMAHIAGLESTRPRFRTAISSRPRLTRPFAVPAAVSFSAKSSTSRPSTPKSSRASRADR